MKRIITIIALISVLALGAIAFAGCAQAEVPGRAWGNKEVVTYNVYSSDSEDSLFATMTNTIEEISGEQVLTMSGSDKKYNTGNGVRFSSVITTIEGEVILSSETLVRKGGASSNAWVSLAGYKKVVYGDKDYVLLTEYDGESSLNYVRTKSDGSNKTEGSVKVGAGYIDSDFIYTYMRTYTGLSSGITKSIPTLDKDALTKVTISSSPQAVGSGSLVPGSGSETGSGSEQVAVIAQIFSRSDTPTGSSIGVLYMTEKKYTVQGAAFSSERIPLTISENGITYKFLSFDLPVAE